MAARAASTRPTAAVIAGIILVMAGAARGATPPLADAQVWTEVDLSAPVGPLTVTGLGVVRLGEGLPSPTIAGGGLTVDLPLGRGWTATAGDLWVRARSAVNGGSLDVQVPLVALTYGWTWRGFHLSERNRAEDLLGVPGLNWRYRNRLQLEHALTFGPVRNLFASDEAFHDVARHLWSRNRAMAGFGLAPAGPCGLQVYYLRQDDARQRPGAINALGLTLKIALK